jgi:hypothetical protein
VTPLRGSVQPTMLAGRAPVATDEVALGGDTLHTIRRNIGDTVTVAGPRGPLRFEIVGQVVMPRLIDAQAIADGAYFTGAGMDRFSSFDTGDTSVAIVGRFAPGVDHASAVKRISRLAGIGSFSSGVVQREPKPLEVQRLEQIHRVPTLLAVFLAVLGAIAVGHLLVTSVRRQRRGLAILKAVGFSRRQLMATVMWQATTVAVVGVLVGAVAGIATGSVLWRAVAHNVGVAPTVTIPLLALVAVALGALLLANVVAAVPARTAARTTVARVLQTE